jgi:uncharacterized protein (TIGR02284 family)
LAANHPKKPKTAISFMNNTDTIDTLNNLIGTLKDGQEGYRVAAVDVQNRDLHVLFDRYSLQRAHFVGQLQDLLHGLGESDPTNTSTIAGAAHRAWINIKAALADKDEHAILAECERGEDHALEVYKTALASDLPKHIHATVEEQAKAILSIHNHVRNMRDALVGK